MILFKIPFAILAGALALFLNGGAATQAAEPTTRVLFQDGKTEWKIYLSPKADPTEQFAAEELRDALKNISGATFEVVNTDKPAADQAIILGDFGNPEVQAQAKTLKLTAGKVEQIAVYTLGERLYLAGNQPRGVLYAVYRFLQHELGVRWLWPGPDGEFIPAKTSWVLPELKYNHLPAFAYRGFHMCGDLRDKPIFTEWMARNFINIHCHGAPPNDKRRGFHSMWSSHNAELPKELYERHPEYFAEIQGKRYQNNICLSNPEVDKIVAARMVEEVRKRPYVEILGFLLSDNQDYCRCSKCAKTDVSTSWFEFTNRLTDELKKEFPELKYSSFAYQGYRDVPKCRIRNCEFVQYTSYGRCPLHPYGSPSCQSNKDITKEMLAWKATGNPIVHYSYEFDVFLTNHRFFPFFGVIEDAVKTAKKLGQIGMIPEVQLHPKSGPDEYAYAIQNRLPLYVYARLLWEPDLSSREILDDWCRTIYGEAAAPMLEYFSVMDRAWTTMPIHSLILSNSSKAAPYLMVEKLRTQYMASLATAEARLPKIADPAARERAAKALTRERVLLGQWNDSYHLATDTPHLSMPLLADAAGFAESASRVQEFAGRPADTANFSTRVRMAWTKDALLVKWNCQDKRIKNLKALESEHDGKVLQDDSVELVLLSPVFGETLHLAANSKGTRHHWRESATGTKDDSWNPEWQVTTKLGADSWEAVMTVPFTSLGRSPNPPESWQATFLRHNGGRQDFAKAVFPSRDTASLVFTKAARTDRSVLWWVGEPEKEGKDSATISQGFTDNGWQFHLADDAKKLVAVKERFDVYWFRRPQGQNKIPADYWLKQLAPLVKNGGIAIFDSYHDLPIDQYFGDRTMAVKSVECKATVPVAGRTTAFIAAGDWSMKPNDLERDLKTKITPAYGFTPASPKDWTVLATASHGNDPAYPYLLVRRYGKGMIVLVGANISISRTKLLENLLLYRESLK